KSAKSIATRVQFLRLRFREQRPETPAPILVRRADERLEERVRLHGLRLEFGVELATEEPGMVRQFADFDIRAVRSLAGDAQPRCAQSLLVLAIEFVSMAMALVNFLRAVRAIREAVL